MSAKKTLRQRMLNDFNLQRGLASEMAKIAGYSSSSALTKVLKKTDGDIEKIDGFVEIVREMYPDRDLEEVLINFVDELNPDRITIRLLLEYSTVYHLNNLKVAIFEKLRTSDKKETKEWLNVYETDHKIAMGEIELFNGVNKLAALNLSKTETKVYSKLAQIYCYYDMKNIYMLNLSLKEIEEEVKGIKNDFIRNSYTGRIFRVKVDISFHSNQIDNLLSSIFMLENALSPTKSLTYLQIGNSYIMKSYDKAMKYFRLALEYKNSRSENQIYQSINFTSLYWGKIDNYINDGTLSNELFYYIKAGNKSQAIKTLEKINFEELNPHQKAFNCFYQGLLFENRLYFFKSIEYFNSVGEKFYKQLPILELKRMGEDEIVLGTLSA